MSYLLDVSVRHAVFIQRYAAGRAREAKESVFALRDDLVGIIAKNGAAIEGGNTEAIDNRVIEFNEEFADKINADASELSASENKFNNNMLIAATVGARVLKPTNKKVLDNAYSKGMSVSGINKITIPNAIDEFLTKNKQAIDLVVSDSVVASQSVSDNVSDLLTHRQPAKAQSLTKTIANSISGSSRETSFLENKDFIEGVEWISVLDSHTTLICSGRDGKVYPVGSSPVPPAHWGCRSTIIPSLISGVESDRRSKEARPDQSYGVWLRKQPKSFQDEYFSKFPDGDKKARLFRLGKLPIDKFRDDLGAEYTLKELQALNPMAFERANLE